MAVKLPRNPLGKAPAPPDLPPVDELAHGLARLVKARRRGRAPVRSLPGVKRAITQSPGIQRAQKQEALRESQAAQQRAAAKAPAARAQRRQQTLDSVVETAKATRKLSDERARASATRPQAQQRPAQSQPVQSPSVPQQGQPAAPQARRALGDPIPETPGAKPFTPRADLGIPERGPVTAPGQRKGRFRKPKGVTMPEPPTPAPDKRGRPGSLLPGSARSAGKPPMPPAEPPASEAAPATPPKPARAPATPRRARITEELRGRFCGILIGWHRAVSRGTTEDWHDLGDAIEHSQEERQADAAEKRYRAVVRDEKVKAAWREIDATLAHLRKEKPPQTDRETGA